MLADIESWSFDKVLDFVIFVNPEYNFDEIQKHCFREDILTYVVLNVDKLYYFDSIRTFSGIDWADHFEMTEFNTAEIFKLFEMVPDNEKLKIQAITFICLVRDMKLSNDTNQLLFDLKGIVNGGQIRVNYIELVKKANMLS